jgi:hypothetical protein
MTAPVMVLPDFDKPFEVVTDACDKPPAVGGVLLQKGRPVAYYSRKLSGTELNYSATDIEMLGVIGALREWRCYLEGKRFVTVMDHKPNTYLDTASNVHAVKRRARWLEECSGYDYEWQYRAGRMNVADPIPQSPQHFSFLCHVAPSQPEQVLALVNIVHRNDVIVDTHSGCTNCATQSLSGAVYHIADSVLAQVMQGDALRHEATGHSYHTWKHGAERCAKRGR